MPSDKEIKLEFRKKASQGPDKYYAVSVLKEEGFMRKKCSSCSRYYWTVVAELNVCGDPACSGVNFLGFRCFYYFRLLLKKNVIKMLKRIECFEMLLQDGKIEQTDIMESLQGWSAYAMHANTYKLRRKLLNQISEIFETFAKSTGHWTNARLRYLSYFFQKARRTAELPNNAFPLARVGLAA